MCFLISSLRKIDYSFSQNNAPEESSILNLASDFVSFLTNFQNIETLSLITPNNKQFIKSRFFLDHLKKKCGSLVDQKSSEESNKEKIKMRVLILEREVDLSTPALLYLYYESLLSSVLGVDFSISVRGETANVKYDDTSKLYEKYRYSFLQQVMEGMPNELKEFKRKYKHLIDSEERLESNNINNALMNVTQHNQELSDSKQHLKHTKGSF